jgi:G:T-mismatch repair DNA endonuclease (very short patch repair protein)
MYLYTCIWYMHQFGEISKAYINIYIYMFRKIEKNMQYDNMYVNFKMKNYNILLFNYEFIWKKYIKNKQKIQWLLLTDLGDKSGNSILKS